MSEELKQLQEQDQLDAYSVFMFAMNSNVTKRKYLGRFIRFLDFIGLTEGSLQERCRDFVNNATSDNKWAVNNIIKFLQTQKQRVDGKEITGATLNNYVKTIKLFCEVTEITSAMEKTC